MSRFSGHAGVMPVAVQPLNISEIQNTPMLAAELKIRQGIVVAVHQSLDSNAVAPSYRVAIGTYLGCKDSLLLSLIEVGDVDRLIEAIVVARAKAIADEKLALGGAVQ